MKHKWGKKFKDQTGMKSSKCNVCGMTKSEQYGFTSYMRSGILYSNRLPECIDWEIENSKTID